MTKQLFLLTVILSICLIRTSAQNNREEKVRFGVCADIHKDIMHDSDARLSEFIQKASKKDLDFIIELGDFCRPYDYNLGFLSIWNSYPGDKYHVIGNHEMDGGFSREQVVKYFGSPAKYYSFDKKGYHFIVLDGNDLNPSPDKAPGYARFIGEEQRNWLVNDLRSTNLTVILFSHQTLEGKGVENRQQIRSILENENMTAGYKKVLACFSGHHHTDYATTINGIHYIQINSMSDQWVGEKYKTIRYSKDIDSKYPWIKYTIPYKDPLYAFVEINKKVLIIKGKKSSFVGPGPIEMGMPEPADNNKIIPMISNRRLNR
jgi:Calcineurin-like phosphoesterase